MIGSAIQRGNNVFVYDEKGKQLTYTSGQLQGYTGSSFSVKRNRCVFVYDEKGKQLSYHTC